MKKIQVFLVIALLPLFYTGCTDESILDAEFTDSQDVIEVSLTWFGSEDLDLHVIEPNGEHLFFGDVTSITGGSLSYMDPECNDQVKLHTETLSYPGHAAPKGTFKTYVDLYGTCGATIPQWTLTIKVNGVVTEYRNNIDMVTGSSTLELDPGVEPFTFEAH